MKDMIINMKKPVYIGIVIAAFISIAGCARAIDTGATVMNEQRTASESFSTVASSEKSDITDTARFVAGFTLEENDSIDTSKKEKYPYKVRTQSAVWYLAAADIELLGEDAFFAGLEEVLTMQDQDFFDAKKALKDYIKEEVAPVEIYTDFCGKAEVSAYAGAYFHPVSHFIKVFGDWKQAEVSLLHEYVHYLTFVFTDVQPKSNFTSEGIAEYISMLVCENRMCKKANYGAPEEYLVELKKSKYWNNEEDAIDLRDFYHSVGLIYANGAYVDQEFANVASSRATRTEDKQQHMHADDCSYVEAAVITEYLVETYSLDTVMANLNKDPMTMSQAVYGKDFSDIYKDFTIWINEKYEAENTDE